MVKLFWKQIRMWALWHLATEAGRPPHWGGTFQIFLMVKKVFGAQLTGASSYFLMSAMWLQMAIACFQPSSPW